MYQACPGAPDPHRQKLDKNLYLSQSPPSEIENQQYFTGQAEGAENFSIAVEGLAAGRQRAGNEKPVMRYRAPRPEA
jgi:hypothetical protein